PPAVAHVPLRSGWPSAVLGAGFAGEAFAAGAAPPCCANVDCGTLNKTAAVTPADKIGNFIADSPRTLFGLLAERLIQQAVPFDAGPVGKRDLQKITVAGAVLGAQALNRDRL